MFEGEDIVECSRSELLAAERAIFPAGWLSFHLGDGARLSAKSPVVDAGKQVVVGASRPEASAAETLWLFVQSAGGRILLGSL